LIGSKAAFTRSSSVFIKRAIWSMLVALSCVIAPMAHGTDCQLKQYASLDLVTRPNGFLVVPVTIQGSPAGMLLNTAAAFSSVTASAAARLGLPLKPMPAGIKARAGENPINKIASASQFAIGRVEFKSADFVVMPDASFDANQSDLPIVGILGMDVLGHFDIELDIANRKLNLFSQDHCPGQAVYWAESYDSAPIRFGELGDLYFPMELQGKKIETTLATGRTTTSLSTAVTRKLFDFDGNSADVEKETDSSGHTTSSYRAMKLSGEGIQIINAHIVLVDHARDDQCSLGSRAGAAAYEGCYGVHPLQLGLNVLSKLRLYIATKEKLLYFTANASPAQAASPVVNK